VIAILATVHVRASRRVAAWILVILILALAVPAVTLASGPGGSAGDQQYTDPFAGTSTPTATTHQSATATTPPVTTAPATTAPAGATPTTTAPPPTTTPAPTTAAAAPSTSGDPGTTPTATTASNTLPYTGYDGWLAATLGFAMVAGGVGLRRRARRA
jgi:hypothetical protein